jgi:flotillin
MKVALYLGSFNPFHNSHLEAIKTALKDFKMDKVIIVPSRIVETDIIKTKKEQELAAKRIKVKQNELEAEVNKEADAENYAEKQDEADLEKVKREAESKKYSMEQEPAGIRAKVEVETYQIGAKGAAEAKSIKEKGLAETQGMEKKEEEFKKYGNEAIVEMITKILPSVSENVAKPINVIDNMNVYIGDTSTISGNVPAVIKQTFDEVKSATGVDMSNIMKAETYDARVNKNFDIKGEIPVSNKSKKK